MDAKTAASTDSDPTPEPDRAGEQGAIVPQSPAHKHRGLGLRFYERSERVHRWLKEFGTEVGMLWTVVVSLGVPAVLAALDFSGLTRHFAGPAEQALFLSSVFVVLVSLALVYTYLWRPVNRFAKGRDGKSLTEELLEVEDGLTRKILSFGPVTPDQKLPVGTKDEVVALAISISISKKMRDKRIEAETGVENSVVALSIWAITAAIMAFVIPALPGILWGWIASLVMGGGIVAWARLAVTYPYYGVALWRWQTYKLLGMPKAEVLGELRQWALSGPTYVLR